MTGYSNGQGGVVSALAGTTLTTRFDASQVSGNSGCNQYTGSYWVSGTNISIGTLASGMMFCAEPAGAMDQEAQFQAALQSAVTFQFDGNRLDAGAAAMGSTAVVFVRLQ